MAVSMCEVIEVCMKDGARRAGDSSMVRSTGCFPEDLDLTPSTQIRAHNWQFQGGSETCLHFYSQQAYIDIHVGKTPTHIF